MISTIIITIIFPHYEMLPFQIIRYIADVCLFREEKKF